MLIEPLYNEIERIGNKLFIVEKNGKKGAILENGKLILDIVYDDVSFDNQLFLVKKNGKYGLITASGKILEEIKYNKIYVTSEPAQYGLLYHTCYYLDNKPSKIYVTLDKFLLLSIQKALEILFPTQATTINLAIKFEMLIGLIYEFKIKYFNFS